MIFTLSISLYCWIWSNSFWKSTKQTDIFSLFLLQFCSIIFQTNRLSLAFNSCLSDVLVLLNLWKIICWLILAECLCSYEARFATKRFVSPLLECLPLCFFFTMSFSFSSFPSLQQLPFIHFSLVVFMLLFHKVNCIVIHPPQGNTILQILQASNVD